MWPSLQTTDLRSKCIHNFDNVNSWLLKKTTDFKKKIQVINNVVHCAVSAEIDDIKPCLHRISTQRLPLHVIMLK